MEISKVSFGAAWPKKGVSKLAGRTRARLGKAPVQQSEQGMTRVNSEILTKMKSKRQLVTAGNPQGVQVQNSARNYPYGHSGGCTTVPLTESCPW